MPISRWYGPYVKLKAKEVAGYRVRRAVQYIATRIREKISRPNPTGRDPSLPGEYPKKVLGWLRKNILWEYDKVKKVGRVGTPVKYGKYLELGTRRMRPRPWLSQAFKEFQNGITTILKSKG